MRTPPTPTRDSILDAAEALFCRKGFRATTIKEIGMASGTNTALLYYYFAGKDGLYRAVLQRLGDALVARGVGELGEARTPEEGIRRLVAAQVGFMRAHPRAPILFVREMVDHDARHAEAFILRVAAELFRRLCGLIEAGQRDGVFRRDLEPRFAAISTIAQVVYFAIARPAVRHFLGAGAGFPSPEVFEAFGRHAADFAVGALRTTPAPRPSLRTPTRSTR